jgi:hypothetical protein
MMPLLCKDGAFPATTNPALLFLALAVEGFTLLFHRLARLTYRTINSYFSHLYYTFAVLYHPVIILVKPLQFIPETP